MDIKVLLGIDMETDVGSFTPFYEGVQKATPMMLDLFAKKGVRATFYFPGHAARVLAAHRHAARHGRAFFNRRAVD